MAIVDNNLSGLEFEGARLAAETVIGYLRAFTDIAYIVSLNKNPSVDFDLRYMFGDYQSQADLALNQDHLGNPRLWTWTSPTDGFAPWYWPCLPDAVARRRRQVEIVRARSGESVWETLQFPTDSRHYLSYRAKAKLMTDACAMDETTFRGFFDRTKALLPADALALGRLADKPVRSAVAIDAVVRLVAGDLDRWLRRDVLGPQDALIDMAHLVARMPFLFEGVEDIRRWNAALYCGQPPFGMKDDLYASYVEPALFRADAWQGSPCFWWPVLRQDEVLTRMFLDSPPWPDAVFCEDTSTFVEVPEADDGTGPLEFESELEGSWPRRFVLGVSGKQYSPRSRLVG